jgi:type 1 glutamine amidotransferase
MSLAIAAALWAADPFSVLVFSKTAGYRHDSIPAAVAAFEGLGKSGWHVEATEDASQFTAGHLRRFDVVVFLLTTQDVLDERQQAAFEGFVEAGGGYVGVHSACDTEYDWPWYGALVGAYFKSHPPVQEADVILEDRSHPTMDGAPAIWRRRDEWYDFREQPRSKVHVLATVDESTYQGGSMGGDHPVAWCREVGKGRSWYTAMGHTKESYSEPGFVRMLARAALWSGRRL